MPFRTNASLWYANSQGTQENINLSSCQIGYAYLNLNLLKVLIFAHQSTVPEHRKRYCHGQICPLQKVNELHICLQLVPQIIGVSAYVILVVLPNSREGVSSPHFLAIFPFFCYTI